MKRLLVALAVAAAFALGARVALAAEPFADTGRVLISTGGSVVVPAGDLADAVVVVNGNVDVQGEVRNLVIIDSRATVARAHIETLVSIGSSVEIGDGTRIDGQLLRLDSTVHQTGAVEITGGMTDLAGTVLAAGGALASALFLLWLGFGLATLVWALLAANVAGRQIREARQLLAAEPILTFVVGLVGVIALPILAIVLMITVIGAPFGVGLLVVALPLAAFAGYLVAASWIGGWVVSRGAVAAEAPERPYLPMVAGVLVLTLIGLVPVLSIVVAVASLLGFGAVIRLLYRTSRGAVRPVGGATQPASMAAGA